MAPPASPAHSLPPVPALTGLRVLLIAYIVVFHARALHLLALPAAIDPYFELRSSMSLFFIMSGFVLAYHYAGRFETTLSGVWSYFWDRFGRIVPLYLISLLAVTPITLVLGEPVPPLATVESWTANLLLVHAFVAHPWLHIWNVPSWYLSALLFFYLAFPFFARGVLSRVRSPRGLGLLMVALCLAIALTSLAMVAWFQWRSPSGDLLAFERRLYSPLLRVWEFFAGCGLGALVVYLRRQPETGLARFFGPAPARNALLAGALAGGLALAVAIVATRPAGVVTWLTAPYAGFVPLFLIAILALAMGRTFVSPVLEHRWLLAFGDASYAVFIFHWLPLIFLFRLAKAGHHLPPWTVGLVLVGLVLIAFPINAYIERPARRWLRRLAPGPAGARRTVPVPDTAPISTRDAAVG